MKKNPIGFTKFEANLPMLVENVKCKGKLIYFSLFNEDGYFYIIHSLKTTDRWQSYEDKYCIWFIETDDGEILWFRSLKYSGTFEFTNKESVLLSTLNKLGPDILTHDFSLKAWETMREKNKNKNITSFLINQNIISGIGNYIKDEALYYAKISPYRKVKTLSEAEASNLYEGIRIISRISYNKNGLSGTDIETDIETYNKELQIYNQPHAKKTKSLDGIITYWDPYRQK